MIVRQFLQWVRNAPPGERADATSALARAYLHSDLSPDDRAAAEGAMIMLLDDPSPLVRRALAEVFASSQKAPPVIVDALAADHPQISVPILSRSPLLLEADLIDLIATSHPEAQTAIAGRPMLQRTLAAAIAEVGCAEACLALLENSDADIAHFSIDRMVERFGHLAAIRENLAGARRSADADAPGAALASCRRRLPVSSPRGIGSAPSTPNRRRGKPASGRLSRSPPRRLMTRLPRWSRICARAASSLRA